MHVPGAIFTTNKIDKIDDNTSPTRKTTVNNIIFLHLSINFDSQAKQGKKKVQ